jgi:hypothetical protein
MIEKQVQTLLDDLVGSKVFFDAAPAGTEAPFIILLQVGGEPIEFLDGPSGQDFVRLQVDVHAGKRSEANALMSSVRERMKTLQASPIGAPVSLYEDAVALYRRVCDFRVIGPG